MSVPRAAVLLAIRITAGEKRLETESSCAKLNSTLIEGCTKHISLKVYLHRDVTNISDL